MSFFNALSTDFSYSLSTYLMLIIKLYKPVTFMSISRFA